MLAALEEGSESSRDPADHTAGELLINDVPRARASDSVAECRALFQDAPLESAVIAVVEGGALLGLLAADRLLRADGAAAVGSLMDGDGETVGPSTTIEAAVERMGSRAGRGIAVADEDGGFLGIVPPARVIDVLLIEHDEDMARLGGYRSSGRQARRAAEEPLTRRLWHRLPWLLVGLAGAMVSVLIVGAFESELDDKVLLAFFVPAVVYMADSVGTQTETLLIRALAADVRLGRVVVRELLTGVATRGRRRPPLLSVRPRSAGATATSRSGCRWRCSAAAPSPPPSRWPCPSRCGGSASTRRSARDRWRP